MIILDLEWNRGYDKNPLDEILQIGAVKVDGPGGDIVDTFNVFIRPMIHKTFDMGAKKQPDLQQSLDSNVTFPEAWAAFCAWCGEDRDFGGWGQDDFRTVERNCRYHQVPTIQMESFTNYQMAYCHAVGARNTQMALWRAVDYCKIPDVFCYHNALNDAMYTAILGRYLTEEDFRYEPPKDPRKKCGVRFSSLLFSCRPPQKIGPFQSAAMALDSRACRRPACPICEERLWVTDWYSADPARYYGAFRCREHGWFLCTLTLTPVENGACYAQLAVPELTPACLEEFGQAKEGESHHCAALKRSKRRFRGKGRSLKGDG